MALRGEQNPRRRFPILFDVVGGGTHREKAFGYRVPHEIFIQVLREESQKSSLFHRSDFLFHRLPQAQVFR